MIDDRPFEWDDALVKATMRDGRTRFSVYRPTKTVVVLGRGSDPAVEIDQETVHEDGVPLLRRRGGGCSVVLDPGNVIVSVVLPLPGFGGIKRAFGGISNWLITALDRSGVEKVHQAGISDLAIGDRKIGGACIYRTRGILYYSTTLLFQPDIGLAERYLKHPPREPAYRDGRGHRAFMGSIAESANLSDIESFATSVEQFSNQSLMDLESSLGVRRTSTKQTTEVLA